VPEAVKEEVLSRLSGSAIAFDAVADLCEMSARRDPAMRKFAEEKGLKIAACYPRAVKWLFAAADAPLQEDVEVLNMRVETAENVVKPLLVSISEDSEEKQS
jgi:hypothetical protein